jgi:hypothetical protein
MDKLSSKKPIHYFLQGALIAGGIFASGIVLAKCIQIDAYKKIVDYKRQYEDYKDQTQQLLSMSDSEKINVFLDVMGGDMDANLNHISEERDTFFENIYTGEELQGGAVSEGAALRKVGSLKKEEYSASGGVAAGGGASSDDSLASCWLAGYGAGINFVDDACSGEARDELAALSIKPAPNSKIVRPNTEIESEVTRALYFNEYPVLDVLRADLAWLRDNPEIWTPLRIPSDKKTLTLQETAHYVQDQQRLGAVLIARGLPFVDYDNYRTIDNSIASQEGMLRASRGQAVVSYVLDAFGSYPASMATITPIKAAIRGVTAEDVDNAKDGDRKAMMLKFTQLESELGALQQESSQRYERLMGVWLAARAQSDYDTILNMQ